MGLYEVERFKDNHPISHKPVQNIIPHYRQIFFLFAERSILERGREVRKGQGVNYTLRENVSHRS